MSWIEDLLARIATVDTVADAIKVVTDALPDAGALNDLATLEARLTAIRAGYLNELDFGLQEAIALCAQTADGWDAALATILDNFTAIRIGYLDELDFDLAAAIAAITTAGPTNVQMEAARDAIIAAIPAMVGTDGAALVADGWDAALATILDNFTAGRIGYLDELDFDLQGTLGTIAAYIDVEIGTIIASQARQLFTMDFWSLPQEEVALTVAAADKGLPSVTVADLPAGATIVRAIAMFKFRMVENHTYAGVNSLDGAQEIQVAASVDAINFVDAQFTLAEDAREGGDVVIGAIDIAATVNANGAYAFHWDLAKALQTGINFNDVQMGIRIWYSV